MTTNWMREINPGIISTIARSGIFRQTISLSKIEIFWDEICVVHDRNYCVRNTLNKFNTRYTLSVPHNWGGAEQLPELSSFPMTFVG